MKSLIKDFEKRPSSSDLSKVCRVQLMPYTCFIPKQHKFLKSFNERDTRVLLLELVEKYNGKLKDGWSLLRCLVCC